MGETKTQPPSSGRNRHFDDDNDDILVIPDLEDDFEDEPVELQIAAAPQNIRQVQSLRELNNEIIGLNLPTSTIDGRHDLTLLTATLSPRDKVIEGDDSWE